jgi:hypothetical protein
MSAWDLMRRRWRAPRKQFTTSSWKVARYDRGGHGAARRPGGASPAAPALAYFTDQLTRLVTDWPQAGQSAPRQTIPEEAGAYSSTGGGRPRRKFSGG